MEICINKLHDKYVEICKSLGWGVRQYKTSNGEARAELENWSPLGENLELDFGAENFVDEVKEYAAYFSTDEHVSELIEFIGTRGVPSSIRELLNDADAIDEMLRELASNLVQAELRMEVAG